MARTPSIEDRLEELARLGKAPDEPGAREQLRKVLSGKVGLLTARAAGIVAHLPDHDFVPDLVAAFERFMVDPVRTDKGCTAKIAIVEALLAADHSDEEIFRTGIGHVQLEPTWGGRADTAAPLRALCGLGLVQVGALDAAVKLAVLLADREPDARVGAAHALGACGPAATPLLRFKVLTGDDEPAVLAECLSALMEAAASESFDFVAGLVGRQDPALSPHAALALAESRLPGAFELLEKAWSDSIDPAFRQTLLLPIALTRHEQAPSILLSVLESGDLGEATTAISALAIFRSDPTIRARAESALRGPHRTRLLALLGRAFD